ncbi:MAG: flagellar hook-basal body protein [Oscillospiraceae bacterium]|jgi:flagellar basal-body rod protein FlgG|nr:flagellar hook-basal body protein [Oscillospiraceae bacterium]
MIRGFYTAGSGLACQQMAMDNTANNIANVNTTGFKKQRVRFGQLLYSNLGTQDGGIQNLKVGNGVRAAEITTNHARNGFVHTGNELDFALDCEGYFGVITNQGVRYTRDGTFYISYEQSGNYLVTASGGYVAGKDGGRVLVDGEDLQSKIGIFNFSNPTGLDKGGDNLFVATERSGEAYAADGTVRAGYIEMSNVDMVGEMSDLIAIQKAFQFNAKMIQTADEIENIINNLR